MALPESYRESTGDNRCDNCGFFTSETKFCSKWDAVVEPEYLCDSWKPEEVIPDPPKGLSVRGSSQRIRRK